jgi:hypothetical protein
VKLIVKVLMFGDRDWELLEPIDHVLEMLIRKYGHERLLVIEGKARGADALAGERAKLKGVHIAEVPALWDTIAATWRTPTRAAGPIRNGFMEALNPHMGFAFHENIEASTGTKDMGKRLGRAGKRVWLHDGKALKPWYS